MGNEATRAITSWIGSLSSGGVIRDAHEEAGVAVAAYVIGEAKMGTLRAWMESQSLEDIESAQRAAIAVCIWLANADRHLHSEEAKLLEQIIEYSRLPEQVQAELTQSIVDPPSLKKIERHIAHPSLRELLLALGWELAAVDGRVDNAEEEFMTGLAKRFEVSPERLEEIRRAIIVQIGA